MTKDFQIIPAKPPTKRPVKRRRRRRWTGRRIGNAANLLKTYKYSKALAHIINVECGTRQDAMKRIWAVAKLRGLQSGSDILADAAFFDCFGQHTIRFKEVAGLINSHLTIIPDVLTKGNSASSESETDTSEGSSADDKPTPPQNQPRNTSVVHGISRAWMIEFDSKMNEASLEQLVTIQRLLKKKMTDRLAATQEQLNPDITTNQQTVSHNVHVTLKKERPTS